jgi:hypothetical protein
MSGKNRVNQDHYKLRGRGYEPENIEHDIYKQEYGQAHSKQEGGSEFIPGEPPKPVNEQPVPAGDGATGESNAPSNSTTSMP